MVAEAICLIFAKKPVYENFIRLINETAGNLVETKLKPYDPDSTSEYVLTQLKNYIDNPSFNEENLTKVSILCASLCGWIKAIYDYGIFVRDNV